MRLTLDIVRQRLARHGVPCPPGCGACCGPVPVGAVEARRAGLRPGLTDVRPGTMDCEHLDGEKRCGVYDERPVICRLMGATDRLPCPIGLLPEAGHMPAREAREIEAWVKAKTAPERRRSAPAATFARPTVRPGM